MLGTQIPTTCPGVPAEILRPKNNWTDVEEFYKTADKLVDEFNQNFEKYKDFANKEILAASPKRYKR